MHTSATQPRSWWNTVARGSGTVITSSTYAMSYDPRIVALIERLAQTCVADDTCNQYADNGQPAQVVRRANLALYLQRVLERGPDIILVGEAPGYLGCRRTGVPFTSDRLLLATSDTNELLGATHGFRHASADQRVPAEQTATLVWRELQRHSLIALGWNAWPFHPHRLAQPDTNRPPRSGELRAGLPLLQAALDLAPGKPIVAMGNCAAQSLGMLGVPYTKVRHPAQGGARQFAAGLAQVVAEVMHRSAQAGTIPDTHSSNHPASAEATVCDRHGT